MIEKKRSVVINSKKKIPNHTIRFFLCNSERKQENGANGEMVLDWIFQLLNRQAAFVFALLYIYFIYNARKELVNYDEMQIIKKYYETLCLKSHDL